MNNPNTKEYWDKYYSEPVKYSSKTMYILFHLIPFGFSVLDIGCGNGELMKRLINVKKCWVEGLDLSEVCINQIVKSGLKGKVGDAENLDDFKENYDVVVLSHTLEHITEDERLIKNCRRIAKKFLLIAVPEPDAPAANDFKHVHIYTKESLTALLKKYFREVEDYSVIPHLILKAHV